MADQKRAAGAPSPPRLAIPEGSSGRGYGETFQSAAFTGTATVTVPIPVLPARGAPTLFLTYTHGTPGGPFGLGMSLSLPAFARRTEKGIPRYDDSDIFLGPDLQELVPGSRPDGAGNWLPEQRTATEDGVTYTVRTYRSRVSPGTDRIERWFGPDGACFWKVLDGSGGVTLFGRSPAARVADPACPAHIFQWLVEEETDALGNRVRYGYKAEDGAGWTGWTPEGGFAARYIESIQYGNYRPAAGADEVFGFEVRFDYGEYDPESPETAAAPVRPWPVRADPIAACRAGFPVQTLRLCRRILMLNHLPEAPGPAPCLTTVLRLSYDEEPLGSRLRSVTATGCRREAGGGYEQAALPPLTFTYAGLDTGQAAWRPMTLGGGAPLPDQVEHGHLQMADLYGEGLPGLLYTDQQSIRYFPPLGEGTYGPAQPLPQFPNAPGIDPPRYALEDLEGNGRLSLVSLTPAAGGFFYNRQAGVWDSFRPFAAHAPEAAAPEARWADLDGDGRSDIFVQIPGRIRFYLAQGADGFAVPVTAPVVTDFPPLASGDDRTLVTFADVLGDGLSHCVRVSDGKVEVWPNLGYGRFGPAFVMAGAPHFGPALRPDRVVLGGLTGTGRADLALIYPDRVELYRNQGGVSFAAPVLLPVEGGVGPLDQITAADVRGTGHACLVVGKAGAPVEHRYLDICGDQFPYLLTAAENGMGGVTAYHYRSSTAYYLKDRERGTPWATTPSQAVTVVDTVEHRDEVTGLLSTDVFQYRDGYYDPAERLFRGFGSVQTQNTQVFHPDVWAFPAPRPMAAPAEAPATDVRLTRAWYHVGAFPDGAVDLAARYRAQYFSGDPAAATVAGASVLAASIQGADAETVRQAMAALAGSELHSETYAVGADGLPGPVPLEVEEHSYLIDLIQPVLNGACGSFNLLPRESVSLDYEGVAGDPRVEHDATLAWDRYGRPTRTVTVYYPRRKPLLPGQAEMRTVLHEDDFLAGEGDGYVLADPLWQTRVSEVSGITPDAGACFTYGGLAAAVEAAAGNRLPFGAAFTSGPQARLHAWTRTIFWDDDRQGPAPLGQSGPQGLVHHDEEALFSEEFRQAVYGDRADAATLTGEAGCRPDGGYWWREDPTVTYAGPDGYHLAVAYRTPFQTAEACTSVAYDAPYWLLAVTVTDPLGNRVMMRPDYQTLEPGAVTDENGVVTEGLYDPLGRLLVLSHHVTTAGGYRGGMSLDNYQRQPVPALDDLLVAPERYLQGASAYFLQRLDTWAGPGSQPCFAATVEARLHADSPTATAPALPPKVTVTHLDGYGRTVEALERVEGAAAAAGGAAWVWVSTHRVTYDQQGLVHRSYLPAFVAAPTWQPAGDRPCALYTYDALEREVREDLPTGFLTRTDYPSAWSQRIFDADDTVTDSPYYQMHIHDPDLPPAERQALEQAARFAGTPATHHLNPQGSVVAAERLNNDGSDPLVTRFQVDIDGRVLAAGDPRLGPAGVANVATTYDMAGRTVLVRRADAGDVCLLHDAMDLVIHRWTARGAHVHLLYDQPVRRLLREELDAGGPPQTVTVYTYGTDPAALTVGRLVRVDDQSGTQAITCYDLTGQPAEATRRLLEAPDGTADWAAAGGPALLDGEWRQAWEYDAAGRQVAESTVDGTVIHHAYWANGWLAAIRLEPPAAPGPGDPTPAPLALVTGLAYTPGGQPAEAQYGNQVLLSWTYDPLSRDLTHSGARRAGDSSLLQDLTYTTDPAGNLCAVADGAAAALLGGTPQPLTKQYTFDALYRLTGAEGWEQAPGAPWRTYSQTFAYDRSDNLTQIARTTGATKTMAVAAASNRSAPSVLVPPGKTVDDLFDPAGNPGRLDDGSTLAFDYEERLAAVTPPAGGAAASYRYDAEGRRIRHRTVSAEGRTADLFHLGSAYVETVSAPGVPDRRTVSLLVSGMGDDLVLLGPADAGGSRPQTYMLSDRLGSVTLELDGQSGLVRCTDYYPYGELSVDLAAKPGGEQPPVRLGFAGKERDGETGLAFFGGRYYLPAWGRWLTPDPLGEVDGLNLYIYVGDNPVSQTDPHGYAIGRNKKQRTRRTGKRRIPWKRKSELLFGDVGAKFGEAKHGGFVVKLSHGSKEFVVSGWWPRKTNTGKGVSRAYPMTNKHYRQLKSGSYIILRKQRSMFRNSDKTTVSFVRGHRVPHADTNTNSPASGGVISTRHATDYYPEPEGWGEQQRKHREEKARRREMPITQVEEYGPSPATTLNGTPIPDRLWFVEFTSLARDATYAKSKPYTAKAYYVDYRTFDYDALPRVDPSSDRRRTKPLRVKSLPEHIQQAAIQNTGFTGFKFKL